MRNTLSFSVRRLRRCFIIFVHRLFRELKLDKFVDLLIYNKKK